MIKDFITLFKTCKRNDPALKNPLELLLYPCLWAIWLHRVAHLIYKFRIPLIPRLISQLNRLITGIEIHPGAKLGTGIFIDHGMGVVIGETAQIGNNCLLFHGVTLGSKGGINMSKTFRHPHVGNNVLLGAGAKLIGPVIIGDGARIGANAIVTKDVEAGQTVISPAAVDIRLRSPQLSSDMQKETLQLIKDLEDKCQMYQDEINHLNQRIYQLENNYKDDKIITVSGTSSTELFKKVESCSS